MLRRLRACSRPTERTRRYRLPTIVLLLLVALLFSSVLLSHSFRPMTSITTLENARSQSPEVLRVESSVSNSDDEVERSVSSLPITRSSSSGSATEVRGAFFYDPACPSCEAAYPVLEALEQSYPYFTAIWFDVSEPTNHSLAERFLENYTVHELYRSDYPFLFIGDYAFRSSQITEMNISTVIEYYRLTAVPLFPDWNLVWRVCLTFFYREGTESGDAAAKVIDNLNNSHINLAPFPLTNEPYYQALLAKYLSVLNLLELNEPDIDALVLIGNRTLINDALNATTLNRLISDYAGQTIHCPDIEVEPDQNGGKICVIVFYSPTCSECSNALKYLRSLESRYPDMNLNLKSLADPKNSQLMISMLKNYNRSATESGSLAVFIGDKVFTRYTELTSDFEPQLGRYRNGVGCPEMVADPQDTVEFVKSFQIIFIISAGLIDGVNPCAFAILVFFITYLLMTGHGRRQILVIGISFSLGVFVIYLLLGLGLYFILGSIMYLNQIKIAVYIITGLVAFVFGLYSIYDARKARTGSSKEMILKIPKRLRRLSDRVIEEHVRLRYFALIAVSTGMAISIFEFMCTGQLYIPAIVAISGMGEVFGLALLYLIVYNLMFIVPLITIFLIVYFGLSSEQLRDWLRKNLARIKLITAAVLIILAVIMFWLAYELV